MSMASFRLLFHCLVIFSCCWTKLSISEARKATNSHPQLAQNTLPHPASICTDPVKGKRKGLRITHRYGPCTPIGQSNLSLNYHEMLVQDQYRVSSINSIKSNKYSLDDILEEKARLPVSGRSIGAGNYVVTVGLGTPKQTLNLIFDTGSEVTWVRCLPCSGNCAQQQGSIFNPLKSSTFSNATCTTSKCDYSITYLDKSYSEGYYGRDTLTITDSDTFPSYAFGCGLNNSDSFGTADGVVGLGQSGGLSLISQTASNFAQIFCYCLPTVDRSSGYLLFGEEALEACQTETYTPLLRDPNRPSLYFVNLLGIQIGSQRLSISSGRLGTIMDSGTVITRLPSSVFAALRSAFQASMSKYPVAPPVKPLLETCYNLDGYGNVTIPTMVLNFLRVNVKLDPSAVVWRENGNSQVCLAFAPNKDASDLIIIGNHQQRSLSVLYDIQENKVEFGNGSCGN
ncbi:hypothetical protein K2173_000523 [Erythroxylum novogranatense]|uniref:Peptidase A1 domain-containing protein n=1 Tax=Erythroxylum novogranatense TaxID=1862640 RepID=A0AAV8SWH0_9ROSI|nr:hypothetical protein K2173_000523 [Erythroxylum novogranatense]